MKKKRVYIYAPNDRFNYGDLIFPYILHHYLKSIVDDIVFCSTTKADLTDLGGHEVIDFRVLYQIDTKEYDNYLIVAGGECLLSSWRLLRYVDKRANIVYKLTKKIFPARIANYCLYKYITTVIRPKTKYPFTVGKIELPSFNKVIYNSVGAAQLKKRIKSVNNKTDVAILESVDYLSVRDRDTQSGLKKMGIDSFLAPDSAILMSDIFPSDFLVSKIGEECRRVSHIPHVFFQIGIEKLHGQEKKYALIINNLYTRYKIKFCLCPIGTALGHEDHKALLLISKYLLEESYVMIQKPNLWEIMYLIKTASLYIGTSLHGAITSMSFETPLLCHGPQKLKSYIETWYTTDSSNNFCTIDEMELKASSLLENPTIITPLKQKELSKISLLKIQATVAD
jgi:hypothetical protein